MIGATNTAMLMPMPPSSSAGLAAMPSAAQVKSMSTDQVDKVSKDFESMFVSQMLEQMFGESEGDEAFGNSETGDVYKGLMMDEYGKQISRAGGIGIADYVKKELLKLQEQ